MRTLTAVMLLLLSVNLSLKAESPFDGNGLFDMIGQTAESEAMQQLKNFLHEDPNTKFSETVWFSRKKGLEIGLKYGVVIRVFVHGQSPYNYGTAPFSGTHPLGIQYTDTESMVLQKLGDPKERKSWGGLLYYIKHNDRMFYTSIEMNEDRQSIKYIFIKEDTEVHTATIEARHFGGAGKSILKEEKTNLASTTTGESTKTSEPIKVGCVSGNCIDGIGTYVWESKSRYIGQFKSGQRTGFGTLYYENGDVYIGDWEKNKQEGNGVYTYNTKGSLKLYSGEWKGGKRKGFGYMLYKNGTQRIGKWDDKSFKESTKKGCLMGDCQNQLSEYIWADDGSRFVGNYSNGKRSGAGTYYYGKGGKYQGDFEEGRREGKGTYYFVNGSKYIGTWHQDKRDGYGTLYQKDGKLIKGTWKAGKLVSKN